MNKKNKNLWRNDKNREFKIDPEIVKSYFNKTLSLVFSPESAKKEQVALFPFINITNYKHN